MHIVANKSRKTFSRTLYLIFMGMVFGISNISGLVEASDQLKALVNKAENGDTEAQISLAKKYEQGNGVPKDIEQAIFWYKKVALKRNIIAQLVLFDIYQKLEGSKKNKIEAYSWLIVASLCGDEEATYKSIDLEKQLQESELSEAEEIANGYYTKIIEYQLGNRENNSTASIKNTRKYELRKSDISLEEVSKAFERHKVQIFTIYRNMLVRHPGLRGTIVFQITIEPTGIVSNCIAIEDQINMPEMKEKLIEVIKSFEFLNPNSKRFVVTYPVNFVPT